MTINAKEVNSMPKTHDNEALGPCGCHDYHMADCPLRTGSTDLPDWDRYDPYYDDRP